MSKETAGELEMMLRGHEKQVKLLAGKEAKARELRLFHEKCARCIINLMK